MKKYFFELSYIHGGNTTAPAETQKGMKMTAGYKTVKASSMNTGDRVYMTAYRGEEIIADRVQVEILSRPTGTIDQMTPKDSYKVRVLDGTNKGLEIDLRSHTMRGPKFLVGVGTNRHGHESRFRVTFERYVEDLENDRGVTPMQITGQKAAFSSPLVPPSIAASTVNNAPRRGPGRPRKVPSVNTDVPQRQPGELLSAHRTRVRIMKKQGEVRA